ncbi:MAG: hypothetical protein JRI68_28620 [Deltaproteobacteria bacterium]|nr:hypothetical protein [Deltaproteobacteria bacterium]
MPHQRWIARWGGRRLVLWLGAGAVTTALVWWLVGTLLPLRYAATLLPPATGLMAGTLCVLALLARVERSLLPTTQQVAAAFGLGLTVVAATLVAQPEALDRRMCWFWTPTLAGSALIVWVMAYWSERQTGERDQRVTMLLGAIAIAATLLHNAQPVHGALAGTHLRTWNVYHYYVGSKYFAELGYEHLYAATLAADDDWQAHKAAAPPAARAELDGVPDFRDIQHARSMTTYQWEGRADVADRYDRAGFRPERWQALGHDTRALRARLPAKQWPMVLTDLGYNPAPTWTVVGTPLANQIAVDSSWMRIIANGDLPLFVAMFAALWWAFGLRVALVATIWVNCIHFNRGRFAGGFLQYDWLASSVIGLALYRRGHGAAAGLTLSWAVMTRGFPALLLVPVLARMARDLVKGSGSLRQRLQRRQLRLIVALTVASGLLFGASHLTGRGAATWPEWVDKIARHAHLHPVMDPQRIGVGRLVMHQPGAASFWGETQGPAEQRLAERRTLLRVLQLLGGLLLVAALLARREHDRMVLMLFGAFLAVTVSRYYGSIWLLLFTLGARSRDGPIAWPAALAGGCLLGMAAWFYNPDERAARYFFANYQALAMFVALCAGYLLTDFRSRRGTRSPGDDSSRPVAAEDG